MDYLNHPCVLVSLVAFAMLFALRIGAEERMMLEAFGDEYAACMTRTKLLVPGIW